MEKLKVYEDSINYTATVVEIKQLFPIEKSDNILRAAINHYNTVVSKDTGVGEWGLFFPAETQLSNDFLKNNNLYRDNTLNKDITKKGYFEVNGRIRCQVFRGVKSEGLYVPISSLDFLGFDLTSIKIGDKFNEIEGVEICKKYVPKFTRQQGEPNQQKSKNKVKITSLIGEGQFHLHRNTPKLKDNIHQIQPDDIISITDKWHGTSAVFSNVIIKRQLNWFEQFLLWCGIKIQVEKYGNVYSSRTVIKDVDGIKQAEGGFYDVDIWGIVNKELEGKILKGITLYGEIVGYLPTGRGIQGQYDYGCEVGKHEFRVYRITSTNPDGHVTEYNWQMVKDYCNKFGLLHVPEFYYGKAYVIVRETPDTVINESLYGIDMLDYLIKRYLEQDCKVCKNKVPAEGIVVRVEKGDCNAYKLKSFKFLQKESADLDNGEVSLEDEN